MTVRVGLHSRGHFIGADRHPLGPRSELRREGNYRVVVETSPEFYEMGACVVWNIEHRAPGASHIGILPSGWSYTLSGPRCSCSSKANFTAKRTQRWPDGDGWVIEGGCPIHDAEPRCAERHCVVCDTTFTSGRVDRKYCSRACIKRAARKRRRA